MPAPTNTTYAKVEELRPMVSVPESDAKPNDALQRYLNASASLIDQRTRGALEGYEAFSESASEVRYFDDDLAISGYVAIHDLLTAAPTVTRDGIAIASTNIKLWPYNRGNGPATRLLFNWNSTYPTDVFTGGGFYNFPFKGIGVEAIAVTGVWGYCTAGNRPWEIKEAVLVQAATMYRMMHMTPDKVAQAIRNPFKYLTDEVEMLVSRFVKDGGVGFS